MLLKTHLNVSLSKFLTAPLIFVFQNKKKEKRGRKKHIHTHKHVPKGVPSARNFSIFYSYTKFL